MGSAAIWYYPNSTRADGGGTLTLQEIALGEPFAALEPEVEPLGSLGEAVSGNRSLVIQRNRLLVRLEIDRESDPDTMAALHTLESHLRRGGVIAACNDATKAWAGYTTTAPRTGDTLVRTFGNPWGALSGSAQRITVGDQVWISSPSPESFRDVCVVATASFASGTGSVDRITLEEGLSYSPLLTPSLVRYRDFYPALVMRDPLQPDPVVRVTGGGRSVSIDVDLVEHLPTIVRSVGAYRDYYQRNTGNGGTF